MHGQSLAIYPLMNVYILWAPESNVTNLKVGNYGEARVKELLGGLQHVSEVTFGDFVLSRNCVF